MCPQGRSRGQGRPLGLHLWCEASTGVINRWQFDSKIEKVFSLSSGQGNLINKDVIIILLDSFVDQRN